MDDAVVNRALADDLDAAADRLHLRPAEARPLMRRASQMLRDTRASTPASAEGLIRAAVAGAIPLDGDYYLAAEGREKAVEAAVQQILAALAAPEPASAEGLRSDERLLRRDAKRVQEWLGEPGQYRETWPVADFAVIDAIYTLVYAALAAPEPAGGENPCACICHRGWPFLHATPCCGAGEGPPSIEALSVAAGARATHPAATPADEVDTEQAKAILASHGALHDDPTIVEAHVRAMIEFAALRGGVGVAVPAGFNVNEAVWVKLTDHGRAYHRRRHAERYPMLAYRAPDESNAGWSKWQLWSLMQDFGEAIHMGGHVPFETTIRFAAPAGGEAG